MRRGSGSDGLGRCRQHLSPRRRRLADCVCNIDFGVFDATRDEQMRCFSPQARICRGSRTWPRFRKQSDGRTQRPCCEGRRPRLLDSAGCGWFNCVAPGHCSSGGLLYSWIGCFDAGAAEHNSLAEDRDVLEFDVVGWAIALYT